MNNFEGVRKRRPINVCYILMKNAVRAKKDKDDGDLFNSYYSLILQINTLRFANRHNDRNCKLLGSRNNLINFHLIYGS